MKQTHKLKLPNKINDIYTIGKLLGRGGFGMVYDVSHKRYPMQPLAAKIERTRKINGKQNKHPQLYYEYRMYKHLHKRLQTGHNFLPRVKMFTQIFTEDKVKLNVMVMDKVGANVAKIFSSHNKSFTISGVMSIGIQMVNCIKAIHKCNVIHRDVKPENFCVGWGDQQDRLFIVDFGLSKCFRNSDGTHIPYRSGKSLTGTPRYASIHCHQGVEQSRRDDMESIIYVLIYLACGKLPWQNLRRKKRPQKNSGAQTTAAENIDLILKKKMDISPEVLCKDMHKNMCICLKYIQTIDFDEAPNYEKIRNLLIGCAIIP